MFLNYSYSHVYLLLILDCLPHWGHGISDKCIDHSRFFPFVGGRSNPQRSAWWRKFDHKPGLIRDNWWIQMDKIFPEANIVQGKHGGVMNDLGTSLRKRIRSLKVYKYMNHLLLCASSDVPVAIIIFRLCDS